ncbi:MAG TPA: ThuA domain-containing protein [Opitutaceae bacterium]|nr:ThuA domain-containing protein [Opitutaceae bacterium]
MKKALILHGGWEGHEPEACAKLFAAELSRRDFTVELSDTLDCLNSAARLAKFDLIVPLWTMGTLAKAQEKNLVTAVREGTGLAGFHGGMGDAFRGAIEYQWMVGGQFVAHPDDIKEYIVRIVKRDDQILRGLGDFKVKAEQYYLLVDPLNQILATTTFQSASAPWVNGVVMPVVWKKMHGAGRVFYSSLGHVAKDFTEVPEQLELTLRGMTWAAR